MALVEDFSKITVFNSFPAMKSCAIKINAMRRGSETTARFWRPILERFILGLSDQQLVTGLAILITGYYLHCKISYYHFNLVINLAWFSSTTHLATLLALKEYFKKRPALRY